MLAKVAALIIVTTATSACAQTRWSHNAPFAALDQFDAIATSNDEYSIWVYWTAQRFRIEYPDGRTAFDAQTLHEQDLAPRITLSCRIDGSSDGLPGPEQLDAGGRLPMHPDAPDVPNVMSLRYWLTAELMGEWERWPATVSFPQVKPYETHVQRQRVHYSFARPDILFHAGPTADAVLSRLAAGQSATLRITGEGLAIEAHLPKRPDLKGAAELMLRHCR